MLSKKPHWRARLTPYGWFLAMAGLIGAGNVLVSTSLHGVGLGNDSISYISAARSLLSGEGLIMYNDAVFSAWPPLLPLLIALFETLGLEPATTGRFLNSLCQGTIVILSGRIMQSMTSSKILAVLGTLAVLTSMALHNIMIELVTEPLFCLLIVVILWKLPSLPKKPGIAPLLLISSLAALACLQRYMGVTIVITSFLLILWIYYRQSHLTALRYASIFGMISVLPIGLWVTRNYLYTSTLTGVRVSSDFALADHVAMTFQVITGWFFPIRIGMEFRLVLVVGLIALALILIWYNRRRDSRGKYSTRQLAIATLSLFSIVYIFILLLVFGKSVHISTICDRFLSPLVVPVIALLVALLAVVGEWLDHRLKRIRNLRHLMAVLFGLWLIYPTICITKAIIHSAQDGTCGYAMPHWQTSSLIKILKETQPSSQIYSNCPQAIYILANLPARLSPYRIEGFEGRIDYTPPRAGNYLIWFKPGVHWSPENERMNALKTPQELAALWSLDTVSEASDGTIYLLRKPPPVEGRPVKN